MQFNSLEFFIFFPIVTVLYYLLPHRFRWFMLLVASCIFYMAFIPAYILILAITILIDYFAGIYIEKTEGKKRKALLILSILSTCFVLFVFKYFNFFGTNFNAIARFFHWNYGIPFLKIILPIGLSFHTFQSLSYVVEVYRGRQRSEHNFGIYALYVMFYPQLVAGPIERPQNMLHQFYEKHDLKFRNVFEGLKLMLWGLFKKVVIADRLAVYVNLVYDNPHQYHGIQLITATIFFAYQIFCDFSGYSDIAIGSAQVMGFKLMTNFDRPYFSKSISEFWRRWHISLSTWFRDYVYIPLGGNRVSKFRNYFNLLITFFLSGFWHGASWTFGIWGTLNGFYLIVGKSTETIRSNITSFLGLDRHPKLQKVIKVLITFILIDFAWIFFRAATIHDAYYIISHMLPLGTMHDILKIFKASKTKYGILCIIILELIHLKQRKGSIRKMLAEKPIWMRWALYYVFIMIILFYSVGTKEQFIYFQF